MAVEGAAVRIRAGEGVGEAPKKKCENEANGNWRG